jgi:murein DD-endopeptidase MepM/ murein hydrolase activator NlpD
LTIKILDISYHQNPDLIDYNQFAYSADGFILRSGYGTGAPGKFVGQDPSFNRHYQELTSRGKPVGAYHFITAYQPIDKQVEIFYNATKDKTLKLGLWADVETEAGATPIKAVHVIEFIERAEALMGNLDIYTGRWCWVDIMGNQYAKYSAKKLWMAAYVSDWTNHVPHGWSNWLLWQYTSSGRYPGYAGGIDSNNYNGTDAEYHAWVGGTVTQPNIPELLYYPLPEGYPISQRFGANPSWYPTSKGHNGVDWACLVGTPVYAMQDGTVIIAEARQEKSGYGRQVRIQHEQGISIYGHLTSLSVKAGDKVTAKQQVGTSGGATDDPCSGMSTGPHLHAEYRLTSGAPQVPGGYVYGAIDIYPLLAAHEEDNLTELYKAKCIVSGLRIRSGPSTNYSIIGYATKDRVYSVYAEEGTWMRISGTANHWVMGVPEYMQVTGVIPDAEKLEKLWQAHKELW